MSNNKKVTVIFNFDSVDQFVSAKIITTGYAQENVTFVDITTIMTDDSTLALSMSNINLSKLNKDFVDDVISGRNKVVIFTLFNLYNVIELRDHLFSYIPTGNLCPDIIEIYGFDVQYVDHPFVSNGRDVINYEQNSYSLRVYRFDYNKTFTYKDGLRDIPASIRAIDAVCRFNTMTDLIIDPQYFKAYKLLEKLRNLVLCEDTSYWPEICAVDLFSDVDLSDFIKKIESSIQTFCGRRADANFRKYVEEMTKEES